MDFVNELWFISLFRVAAVLAVMYIASYPFKNAKLRALLSRMLSVEVRDWKWDVALPALLSVAMSAAFYFLWGFTLDPALASVVGVADSIGVAPFFEEVFVRGLIMGSFLYGWFALYVRKAGVPQSVWEGFLIGAVSVFFLVMHPIHAHGILVSSLLYSGLYVWRRSLVPAIVAHSAHNFTLWVLVLAGL